MTDGMDEKLVQALTAEVLRRLSSGDRAASPAVLPSAPPPVPSPPEPRRRRALVLGDSQGARLGEGWTAEPEESYRADGDIGKFDAVYIASLTNAQLCDIALGRDAQPFACAVVKALLQGVPVRALPGAPLWRRHIGSAPPALARTLRAYEDKLKSYGVEFLADGPLPGKRRELGDGGSADGKPRVITAELAKRLCRDSGEIVLRKGDIVTPLARDVFSAAKAKVGRPDCRP